MKKLLILLISVLFLIPLSSAIIDFHPTETGDTYITWEWNSGLDIQNISVDGYQVCSFDTLSTRFTLTGLESNETHTLKIYNSTNSGVNTATTKTSSESSLWNTLSYYKYFIAAILFLLLSIVIDSPIFGLFGAIIMGCSFVFYLVISTFSLDTLIYGIGLMISVMIGLAQWK